MAENGIHDRTAEPRIKTVSGIGLYFLLGVLGLSAGVLTAKFFAGAYESQKEPAPERLGASGWPSQGAAGLNRLREPRPLPDITFTDSSGQALRLAGWRGKFVLVNIWATWCSPCKAEMASLDRLQGKLGGGDFAVVTISTDRGGPEVPAAFFAKEGIRNLTVYNDKTSAITAALGVPGLPYSLILDREGREIARLLGPAEWDGPEASAKLKELVNGP